MKKKHKEANNLQIDDDESKNRRREKKINTKLMEFVVEKRTINVVYRQNSLSITDL